MKNQSFKFSPWYFVSAIVLFYFLSGIIAAKGSKNIVLPKNEQSILTEINEMDSEKEGPRLLFFYRNNSALCDKMRYNIEQLNADNVNGIQIYAVDVEEDNQYVYQYKISGVHSLLILDGEVEKKRVMGVVSTGNLEKIISKITSY